MDDKTTAVSGGTTQRRSDVAALCEERESELARLAQRDSLQDRYWFELPQQREELLQEVVGLVGAGQAFEDAWADPRLRSTPEHTRLWLETELAKVEVSS